MFATTFVAYLDAPTGMVQFASAGHNPPLLYRAIPDVPGEKDGRDGSPHGDKNIHCEYLESNGVALGVFNDVSFDEQYRQLKAGDILAFYTDGITEILDIHGEEFGEERLERLVVENASATAEEIKERIVSAVSAFSKDGTPYDDETLVIVKRVHTARFPEL
jgi:sigma-B regulation protein RsbU (phosphoserine phosphatase)